MKSTLVVLLIIASSLTACNRSPSRMPAPFAPDVLAKVDGQVIQMSDFQQKLKRSYTASAAWPQEREALLNELVKFESIYIRARQSGFDQRPEIARKIKAFIVDQFLEEQLKDQPEAPPVSEAEIENYYREHRDRFAIGEKVRVAVIQIGFSPKATEEKKIEVVQRMESVLAELAAGHPFGTLAQRHSEDQATRYIGGDVGWLARGESSRWPAAVIEAGFALRNPGELSPVVQTSNACYVVKLIEKQGADHRPLAEVAEVIRYQLAIQKRHGAQQAIYERMMNGLQIEINRALLNNLPPPPAPSEPTFALPGS